MQKFCNFDQIFQHLSSQPRRKVAVAWPHDEHTLEAAQAALDRGIAEFLFIGDPSHAPLAEVLRKFPRHAAIVAAHDSDEAARIAVALVKEGRADVLMKGLLNTDNLLRAVLSKTDGILPPGSTLSHVTASQIDGLDRLLLFSDAAVIPSPAPQQHAAIVGYLAQVCRTLGNPQPKIALIHCNEKISPKFPVTETYIHLRQLCAERAFGDAVVDGPMDVKTALDAHSAAIKGIESPVCGHADALVFPDIEAANVFYKTISFFAASLNAGMLMGASAPVVLPSRSDSTRSKLCSLALACLYASQR